MPILRVTNLPITAGTADIRRFFAGLRIPRNGIKILEGDNDGDNAFIAFVTDEDARLAMRKDGGIIKDSRIKIFLSSRMEMQREDEKITKGTFDLFAEDETAGSGNIKSGSDEKRRRSRSPHFSDSNFEENKPLMDYRRSMSSTTHIDTNLSPMRSRSYSPRRSPKLPVQSELFGPKEKPVDDDSSRYQRGIEKLERLRIQQVERKELFKKMLKEEQEKLLEFRQKHPSLMTEPEIFLPDNKKKHDDTDSATQ